MTARKYHLKPHPSRPYDHQFHRPLRPTWVNRTWWFDSWANFIWGSMWVEFHNLSRPYDRHPYWRRA